ncbi:MAG TPA: Calx-beta domain-containing protein [Solirubrobacteraceae bacterium]|nr:Calx-beta domain-containing protein [Solirubrobacteraceae bacterium]
MFGQGWRAMSGALVAALVLLAPAAAQAAIVVDDVAVTEGNGGVVATFTLTRDAGLLAPARTVAFATADGTARAPADYAAAGGSLSFPAVILPETQVRQVSVAIAGDRLDEPTETLRLLVSGAEVTDGEGVATIADDDPAPAVAVADAQPAPEGATATFAVGLSAPSGRDVSVAFTTANASATAGQDYTARAGTLTIAAGSTSAQVGVPLLDDSADEPSETFELRLSSPGAATLGDAVAVGTIVDTDEPPAPPAPAPVTTGTAPFAPGQAPAAPSTGSSVSGPPRLGVSDPRLRQPATAVITIACPREAGKCTGQLTLFSRPNKRSKLKALRRERRLGRRSFALAGGHSQTISMALTKTDRNLLDRAGRIEVRAFALMRDGSGRSGLRTVNGTLIRRSTHSSPSRPG